VNTALAVGKQWQKNILPKTDVYSGLDIGISYAYQKVIQTLNLFDETTTSDSRYGLFISPFVGFTYQMNERFALSFEAAFKAEAQHLR
jgi:hypothetical protein